MTEQLEEGIRKVKNVIRMEDHDLTEAGAHLLVTIEQLIENLEYVNEELKNIQSNLICIISTHLYHENQTSYFVQVYTVCMYIIGNQSQFYLSKAIPSLM